MAGILRSLGVRSDGLSISFLVVGAGELCEKLSEGLHRCAREKKLRILTHQCESVDEVVQSRSNPRVDFVVFAFDSRVRQSLKEVERNLRLINEHYIISGCASLVMCNGVHSGLMFNKSQEICDKYSLRFMSANFDDAESCALLGSRIINLAESVLGLKNGVPTLLYRPRKPTNST